MIDVNEHLSPYFSNSEPCCPAPERMLPAALPLSVLPVACPAPERMLPAAPTLSVLPAAPERMLPAARPLTACYLLHALPCH